MTAYEQIDQRIVELYRIAAKTGADAVDRINSWDVRVTSGASLQYRSGTIYWRDWNKTDRKTLREILIRYTHRGEVWCDKERVA